jgi:hypothetical protein
LEDRPRARRLAPCGGGVDLVRAAAFKVGGKLFVWPSPNRDAPGALALPVDPEEKELILESSPHVYFTVLHYDGYPAVLVRLDRIDREALRERIEDAWLLRAPRKLADELQRGHGSTTA